MTLGIITVGITTVGTIGITITVGLTIKIGPQCCAAMTLIMQVPPRKNVAGSPVVSIPQNC
jgi:hypothetical protein